MFMAACLYTLEECLRNGIWDRHIKASLSTSIVGSLVGGVLSAVVTMFATHSLAVAGVTGVITVVFTFTLMQAAISEYKNATRNWKTRRKKLMNRNKSCRQYGL